MKKSVVITGASGFVGANLNRYLKKFDYTLLHSRVRYESSISLENSFDSLIHLSGKAHDLKGSVNSDEYYKANYFLTRELYDQFLISEGKKFIYFSSVKAVTDHIDESLTEDITPNPKTHYGKSKLSAEEYIQRHILPQGKSYYILRPCMIHGPGNKGNLNLLYNLVAKGIPYPLASFLNKRSFLSVENLCFIIKEILERDDIPSGIYNVADDEPLSTNEVVKLLAQAHNRAPRLLKIPKSLISAMAKLGDKLHLPLTTERLQKLTENFVVSNKKIKDALKKDLPLTAREGILKTARSFKNRLRHARHCRPERQS